PQQHGGSHGSGPGPFVTAEQRLERLAKLVRPQRPVMEKGELPALERLEQIRFPSLREPHLDSANESRSKGIQPCRLAGRNLSSERRDRPHAVGSPVEALEKNRAGGYSARSSQAERAHCEAELGRRIRCLTSGLVEVALELENERAIDLAPESRRQERVRLRPRGCELTARRRADGHAPPQLDRPSRGHTHEWRKCRGGSAIPEQRALE